MKIQVVKTNNGFLKPAYNSDHELFSKIKPNEIIEIEYKKKRNVKFHRLFFALMNLAFENQEAYNILDVMRKDIIKHAGYYTERVNAITGEITQEPNSISFSSMEEKEFNKLYTDCKTVISEWLSIDNEMIAEEIEQFF
jgi:hypothetical protein